MLLKFRQKRRLQENAKALFEQVILQARKPVFYEKLGVPDTVEGRFEMITLHMFVILRRFNGDTWTQVAGSTTYTPDDGHEFAQYLFDAMFRNMDDNLRELGVGDLSVGKKIRTLAEAFYGRLGAYEVALKTAQPEEEMRKAVNRNILSSQQEEEHCEEHALALVDYILRADDAIQKRSQERLILGITYFPEIIS